MTGRPRARRGALVALVLLVAAAATSATGCALVPTPWVGGWQLRTIDGRPAAAQATIVLTASDVVFETGCNQGAGQYEMANGRLTLKDVAFTAVGCPGAVGMQDAAFVALSGGTHPVRLGQHADDRRRRRTADPRVRPHVGGLTGRLRRVRGGSSRANALDRLQSAGPARRPDGRAPGRATGGA